MAKRNGTIWKIILGIAGLIVTGLIAMQAFGVFQGEINRDVAHNHEAIEDIELDDMMQWEQIDANTYYRAGDTKDTEILTERINSQGKILGDRIDNLQEDMQDFAEEQRSVNKEILKRLPE